MVDCAGLGGRRMTSSALPQSKAPPLGMEFSFQAQDHNALTISIVRFLVAFPPPGLVTLRQTFVRRSQNCVGPARGRCTAGFQLYFCPLWVNRVGDDKNGRAALSALPPKADKPHTISLVRFVPQADMCGAAKCIAIRSPRRRGRAASVARRDRAPWPS